MKPGSVRATTVEDIFYPSDPQKLDEAVRALLESVSVAPDGASAVLSPHAAFDYAGPVMAAALHAASDRRVDRVVVLAPIHRDPPPGFVLPESHAYGCPLGDVEVDRVGVEALLDCGTVFSRNDIPHLEEHSIEVLLPFIRRLYPGAKLLPVLTGRAGKRAVVALARGLELCFGSELDRTLFVASANIASTFPRGSGTPGEADRLIELVLARRWEEILTQSAGGELSCCGAETLASLLAYGHIATDARVLARSVCSDESGRRQVHYAAVSFRARR